MYRTEEKRLVNPMITILLTVIAILLSVCAVGVIIISNQLKSWIEIDTDLDKIFERKPLKQETCKSSSNWVAHKQ